MFEEAIEYLPVLIRIAAVLLIAAALYDYFRRKWAKAIAGAVRDAGADSPENAVGTRELEKSHPGITKLINILLKKEYFTLRRVVKCITPVSEEDKNSKKRKNRSEKLTGDEKWYILPPPPLEDEENGEMDAKKAEETGASLPAVLREGGEVSTKGLILGCVLTAAFAELIIYFLPQIVSFFTNLSNLVRE